MARWSLALVVPVVVAVVAGCGSVPAGPPDPFPPRPQAIDIERLDPCALLTPEQQEARNVGSGQAGSAVLDGATTRACSWVSIDSPLSYAAQLIPQSAVGASGEPGTIDGYGSVRVADRVDTYPRCDVLLDVNDDQLIRIQVEAQTRPSPGDQRSYPVAEVCAAAEKTASDVLRSARRATP
ncbi:DUF3558 family protein [Pseudonocardia phyllosphaerae]|uniref:DUF3558 family protein n=1 Tax=Pseudonocardia phyllosphaerae TaxID=3390502 RepID=UPI003978AF63